MKWLKDLKKFTGEVGKAVGTVGGVLGGAAVGAVEAGYNKLNGMDDDEIKERFEKTVNAGEEIGGEIGEGIGGVVPEIAATLVAGKVVDEVANKKKSKKKENKKIKSPKINTAKNFYSTDPNDYTGINTEPPMGGGSGGSNQSNQKKNGGHDYSKTW
ncbi:MAG: hypothetical protein AAF806_01290 [Bacteroidota bacterium]